MKATVLNIVWKPDARFAVAVRPARRIAPMVNRPHRRLILCKRSRTLRLPIRDTADCQPALETGGAAASLSTFTTPLPEYALVHENRSRCRH